MENRTSQFREAASRCDYCASRVAQSVQRALGASVTAVLEHCPTTSIDKASSNPGAPKTVEQFEDLLRRSGLLSDAEIHRYCWVGAKTTDRRCEAAHLQLARHLVTIGALTSWQANGLLNGRWRGFLLGDYKLLRKVGGRYASAVFLGERVETGQRMAMKALPRYKMLTHGLLADWYRLARSHSQLNHEHVARVYAALEEHSRDYSHQHYLLREFIDGVDLDFLLANVGTLAPHEAVAVVSQLAQAVVYAHDAGVAIQRIFPCDIVVSVSGMVKLLNVGSLMVDPNWPKVPGADPIPARCFPVEMDDREYDIYCLGKLLDYMLRGADSSNVEATVPFSAARPRMFARFAAIHDRMVTLNPAMRFRSARDVAAELMGWLLAHVADVTVHEGHD